MVTVKAATKIPIGFSSDFEYYKYLAEILNLRQKYVQKKSMLGGRELDLLSWMAVGSDKSKTLMGGAFREWLMENGRFDANDIYRYTASLIRKGWLVKSFIKITNEGEVIQAKSTDIGSMKAYELNPIFDKKRVGTQIDLTINAYVDGGNIKSEEQDRNQHRDTNTVPDSEAGVVRSAL